MEKVSCFGRWGGPGHRQFYHMQVVSAELCHNRISKHSRRVELHVDGPTTTMMMQKGCLSALKQDGLRLELFVICLRCKLTKKKQDAVARACNFSAWSPLAAPMRPVWTRWLAASRSNQMEWRDGCSWRRPEFSSQYLCGSSGYL